MKSLLAFVFVASFALSTLVRAAPDENELGRRQGYPIGTPANYFYDEYVRVGSFFNLDKIPFQAVTLAPLMPSRQVLPLPQGDLPAIRWRVGQESNLTLQDYLDRQRTTALLIIKDGKLVFERYQYDRNKDHRFISHSMAKSIAALAVGFALQEGKVQLDARADALEPALKGTLYGEATVRQLLRMSSGVKFEEIYNGKDDLAKFSAEATRAGIPAAAQLMVERAAPAGEKFHYASSETQVLSQVLQAVLKEDLAAYLSPRLWQAMGAETQALWMKNNRGIINAAGAFNATARDYARLGVLLANDGARPDTGVQIIPKEYLQDMTDWQRQPQNFHPNKATPYFGYGYQTWLFPGKKRRFALLAFMGKLFLWIPSSNS